MIEGKSLEELRQLIDAANAEIARLEEPMREAVNAFSLEYYGIVYQHDTETFGVIEAGLRAAYPHLKRAMGDA